MGVGMMFRGIVVMSVLLLVVATGDTSVGVSAALLYAIAYTLELVLSVTALLRERGMRHRLRSLVVALSLLALALPAPALAKGEFHPEDEFELHPWISIEIGPLDLSINKAVVYLLLGALVTFLLGVFLLRYRLSSRPNRRQTVGEWVYEIAQEQVAEQGLPSKGIKLLVPVRRRA